MLAMCSGYRAKHDGSMKSDKQLKVFTESLETNHPFLLGFFFWRFLERNQMEGEYRVSNFGQEYVG